MRLRTLELIRYGAYADRRLELGEQDCDLHLVVGPNEAGKSTLLSAIGDLLFGFPAQSSQDWRFGYQELRVRAEIEYDGGRLCIVRRKGNKNTLLDKDGTALPDDTLVPLLGGLERPAFDRMFGLDHAKLRSGAQAMLEGRDDAARTLFEAGTGLAAAGAEVRRLEALSQALFKPGGSNPPVNQLLRERQESIKRVREATLGDAELAGMKAQEDAARTQRDTLIREAETIALRVIVLERISRCRSPMQRLAAAVDELTTIGAAPKLPGDARRRFEQAQVRRSASREALEAGQEEQERAQAIIDASPIPEATLAEQPRIEGLEERRPAVEKAVHDLLRRRPELDASDRLLASMRGSAGLPAHVPLPSESWCRRLGALLEAHRAIQIRAATLDDNRAEHARERAESPEAPATAARAQDLSELRNALDDASADSEARLRTARRDADEASRRAAQGLSALEWSAGGEALAGLALPSSDEVSQLLADMEAATKSATAARERRDRTELEAAGHRRRADELEAGGDLPTEAAVAAARGERGEALGDVLRRLGRDREASDSEAGGRLTTSIARADILVDRRETEASRIAEHAIARAAHGEALAELAIAQRALMESADVLAQLHAGWGLRSADIGLPAALTPLGLEAWRAGRGRVLQDIAAAEAAEARWKELQAELAADHTRLGRALETLRISCSDDLATRVRDGRRSLQELEEALRSEALARGREEGLRRQGSALDREEEVIRRENSRQDEERNRLVAEAGLSRSDYEALTQALEELGNAAREVVRRDGFARQVDAMDQDVTSFRADAEVLFAALGRGLSDRLGDAVRALAIELRAALERSREVHDASERLERADAAVGTARRALAGVDENLAALMTQANVTEEPALESAIDTAERVQTLEERRDQAVVDLQEAGEGRTIEELRLEIEALPVDAALVERSTLLTRRAELDSEREGVGRDLAETLALMERAAVSAEAAEAQQSVAEAQGALGAAAERHVEAASQAALLRWVIDRYRATSQAPLLSRAGELLALATQGACSGLSVDYDDQDKAQVVATRPDGSRTPLQGLSEGTRDQLYLSLRLGSLLNSAQNVRPPLICDDLLSSSDDDRAAALLRLLKEASSGLQILVFTHHQHLIEVAAQAIGRSAFRLHRLEPVLAAA